MGAAGRAYLEQNFARSKSAALMETFLIETARKRA
jgi:hypothetical protein